MQEPFPVFADAVLEDGHWLITRSSYALVDQPQHIKVLIGEV